MGYGGATWDAAGTLAAGDNTFDVADADPGSSGEYSPGWWTYTSAVDAQLTVHTAFSVNTNPGFADTVLDVFTGDDEGTAVNIESDDDTYGGFSQVVFTVAAGVTYHIRVTSLWDAGDTSITTYVLTASSQTYAATPWISTLQDDDRNWLVVSREDLDLDQTSGLGTFSPFFRPGWFDDVIDRVNTWGRSSQYRVSEILGGADPISAEDCAWSHAAWGDNFTQYWSSDGTSGGGTGSTFCLSLTPGDADVVVNPASVSRSLTYEDPDLFLAGHMQGRDAMKSRNLWFLPARDNLNEFGVLNGDGPEADGVPAEYADDAIRVWEGGLELVKVELTGDRATRPADGTEPHGVQIFCNDAILPAFGSDHWIKGVPVGPAIGEPHEYLSFEYADGDPVWHELTEFTSWEACSDYTSEAPDARVGIAMADVPDVNESFSNPSEVAVKFTFRSPRYKWLYLGPVAAATVPPRRIFGRPDGATHGARRALGGGNTRQSGPRTLGSIL